MNATRKNALVGLVVLIALTGFGWMILSLAGSSSTLLSRGVRFTLEANRADGIAEGSPVDYLGMIVGRVLKVEKLKTNAGVRITAALNNNQSVPDNVTGDIRPQGVLSSTALIDLDPVGEPSPQPLKNDAVIKAHFGGGGMIPREIVNIATEIREQQLIAHLTATIDELHTQLANAGKVIQSTDQLLNDPNSQEAFRGTIASLRRTSANVEKLSDRLNAIGDEATSTLRQARTTVADGGAKFDQVSDQVTQRMQQLAAVLDHFQSISNKIDRGEGTAGKIVNDPRLYESLVDSSRDLDITIKDVQRLAEQWEQEGFTLKLK